MKSMSDLRYSNDSELFHSTDVDFVMSTTTTTTTTTSSVEENTIKDFKSEVRFDEQREPVTASQSYHKNVHLTAISTVESVSFCLSFKLGLPSPKN